MSRMLYMSHPGYRRQCRRARRGCTCYYFAYGRQTSVIRRRIARKRERAEVRVMVSADVHTVR